MLYHPSEQRTFAGDPDATWMGHPGFHVVLRSRSFDCPFDKLRVRSG